MQARFSKYVKAVNISTAGIIILLLVIFAPRERYLLEVARKINGSSKWELTCGYDWLSSDTIILCRGDIDTGRRLFTRDIRLGNWTLASAVRLEADNQAREMMGWRRFMG